jgi:hypothetical protein
MSNEAQMVQFVGGPLTGPHSIRMNSDRVAIPLGTDFQPLKGNARTAEAFAIYLRTRHENDAQFHFQFVQSKDQQLFVEFADGPLKGWHPGPAPAQHLVEVIEVPISNGKIDADDPTEFAFYQRRLEHGNWRFYFLKVEDEEDYAVRTAVEGQYQNPDDSLFTMKPTGEHKQVYVEDRHRKANVDELLAPLILECWKSNWETLGSCQQRSCGQSYISFPRPAPAEAFVAVARDAGIDGITTKPMKMTIAGSKAPDQKREISTLHAWFSPGTIGQLVNAVRTARMVRSLRQHATRFRQAVERSKFTEKTPNLQRFPAGCCDHVSLMLGIYLLRILELGEFTMVRAERSVGSRHCWLEKDGILIDLTADQFDEGLPGIIVNTKSPWHDSLKRIDDESDLIDQARCDRLLEGHFDYYRLAYAAILETLSTMEEVA